MPVRNEAVGRAIVTEGARPHVDLWEADLLYGVSMRITTYNYKCKRNYLLSYFTNELVRHLPFFEPH